MGYDNELQNEKEGYSIKPTEKDQKIALELELAKEKYLNRIKTIKPGYWEAKTRAKVQNSLDSIEDLLAYYKHMGSFSREQVAFAKKLIASAAKTDFEAAEREIKNGQDSSNQNLPT